MRRAKSDELDHPRCRRLRAFGACLTDLRGEPRFAKRNDRSHPAASIINRDKIMLLPRYSPSGSKSRADGSNARQLLGRQIQQPVHRVAGAGGVAPTDAVDNVLMYV
jgi:hypothetical protein